MAYSDKGLGFGVLIGVVKEVNLFNIPNINICCSHPCEVNLQIYHDILN